MDSKPTVKTLLFILLLCTCGRAQATTLTEVTWTGAVSNDWYTAGNWSTNQVPGIEDVVIIDAGANPAILSSGAVTVASLTTNTNGAFTLAEGATLTLSGGAIGLTANEKVIINGNLVIEQQTSLGGILLEAPLYVGAAGSVVLDSVAVLSIDSLVVAGSLLIKDSPTFGILSGGEDAALVIEEGGACSIIAPNNSGISISGGTVTLAGTLTVTDGIEDGVFVEAGSFSITETGSLSVTGSQLNGILIDGNNIVDNSGTLIISESGDNAVNGGKVINRAGGTFRVAGNVNSEVDFISGSRVEPGGSAGCLTFNEQTDLRGATGAFEINGVTPCSEYDQIRFDVYLDIRIPLELSGTHLPVTGETFLLVQANAFAFLNGTFSGLPEGATIEFNDALLEINYQRQTGGEAMLTTVQGSGGAVWTGAVSSDWHTGGNWRSGEVPSATDEVRIEAATNPTVVATRQAEAASILIINDGSLTVAEGASLTLSGGISGLTLRTGGLTVNGDLLIEEQSNGNLILNAPVQIGTNGHLAFNEASGGVLISEAFVCAGEFMVSGGAGVTIVDEATFEVQESGKCSIDGSNNTSFASTGDEVSISGELSITNSGSSGIYRGGSSNFRILETGVVFVGNSVEHGVYFDNSSTFTIQNSGTFTITGSGLNALDLGIVSNTATATFRCDGNVKGLTVYSDNSRLEIGDSLGCLSFENSIDLENTTMAFTINGTTACSEYDQLTAMDFFDIDGATLELTSRRPEIYLRYLPETGVLSMVFQKELHSFLTMPSSKSPTKVEWMETILY